MTWEFETDEENGAEVKGLSRDFQGMESELRRWDRHNCPEGVSLRVNHAQAAEAVW